MKNKNKHALCRYMIRSAFLQQLMFGCENECTLSALCTKAHARKFPVFSVSKATFRRPSGCIILHILSLQKRGVLVFHGVLWRSFLTRARQEGTVPLSQGCFPECLSTPTARQAQGGRNRLEGNQI